MSSGELLKSDLVSDVLLTLPFRLYTHTRYEKRINESLPKKKLAGPARIVSSVASVPLEVATAYTCNICPGSWNLYQHFESPKWILDSPTLTHVVQRPGHLVLEAGAALLMALERQRSLRIRGRARHDELSCQCERSKEGLRWYECATPACIAGFSA